jgi:hypothetical protein
MLLIDLRHQPVGRRHGVGGHKEKNGLGRLVAFGLDQMSFDFLQKRAHRHVIWRELMMVANCQTKSFVPCRVFSHIFRFENVRCTRMCLFHNHRHSVVSRQDFRRQFSTAFCAETKKKKKKKKNSKSIYNSKQLQCNVIHRFDKFDLHSALCRCVRFGRKTHLRRFLFETWTCECCSHDTNAIKLACTNQYTIECKYAKTQDSRRHQS